MNHMKVRESGEKILELLLSDVAIKGPDFNIITIVICSLTIGKIQIKRIINNEYIYIVILIVYYYKQIVFIYFI